MGFYELTCHPEILIVRVSGGWKLRGSDLCPKTSSLGDLTAATLRFFSPVSAILRLTVRISRLVHLVLGHAMESGQQLQSAR